MASEKEDTEKRLNWIKTSLSLLFLKEGLVEEINQQADNLHDNVKQLVQTKCPNATTTTCKYCTSKTIKKAKKTTQAGTHWFVNCRSNVCNHWLDALLVFHEHLPSPNVEWVNCNPTLWPSQPWEVAKVFQPYGCEHHTHAGDSDVAALLTFMLDCKYINKSVANKQILCEIKDCRNQIMHSAQLEIEDADMLRWHNDMITLLEDKKRLGQLPSCQAAADKIRAMRDRPIKLSFDKEEENTALSLQISTLTAEISNIQLKSDGLRCDLNEQKKESQRSSEECEHMRQELSSTGATIAQIKGDIETLQKSLDDTDRPQLQNKVSVLQQHLQSLSEQNQENIRELEDRISVIENDVGAMKAQMKSHESEIASIQQEQVRGKEVDVVCIQQRLISLYNRNCQRVPIYPLRPEWRKHVADLFVAPSMTVMNPRGIRVQQRFNEKGLVSHCESTETRVENIRDIFYDGNTLYKDIFIAGDSGNGKSVLCEYLVHMWVKVHSSNVQNLAEEKFMEIFTFLFYISLREASRQPLQSNDVERMIQSQLNLEHVDLSKLILDHTCLIILDGLDEFSPSQKSRNTRFGSPNLPDRPLSENSTVLTTSRPWKLELLAIELEGKIDRMISLRGIEKTSQKYLVRKIVSLLNSEYGREEKFQHFFEEVKDKNLAKYLETPVLLTQMLGLWFSGESLGRSQCSIYSAMINKQLQFTENVKLRGLPTTLQKEEQTKSKITGKYQLPTCLTDQAYCQKYKSVLLKLSKLAYECLFSENKENSLVFGHQQMEICGMSKDEIQTSLHMGLVTQYKVFGEITKRLSSISFIHKSHQEFFAAVYLSQVARASDLKQLLESFSDLDRILEIENVFTFVSGMNPKVSCEIAKVIMDKASGDSRLQQYRQSCADSNAPYEALVKQIQGMILTGIEEGNNHGHKITGIQLHDLWMKNEDRDFPPSRVLACTQALELSNVMSIFIYTLGDFTQGQMRRLIKASTPNLHKFVLFDCDISVDKIQKVVRRNPGILQALGLYYYKRDSVDFSRLERKDLKKILSAPKRSLALYGVILTHAQLEFLCRHLSECSYRDVILANLQCTTHEDRAKDCKQHVDLSTSKNISRLELVNLPLQEVVFIPENLVLCDIAYLPETVATNAIRCLSNAVKLETFQCRGLIGSALIELGRIVPHLVNLKHIFLIGINLSGHEPVLWTPDMKQLEAIGLWRVTVTSGHLHSLLSTIPSHRVRVELGQSSVGTLTITSYSRTNDFIQKIRDNPNTHVIKDEVEYECEKCVVKQFWFYTSK